MGESESGRCGQEFAIQRWLLRQIGLYMIETTPYATSFRRRFFAYHQLFTYFVESQRNW